MEEQVVNVNPEAEQQSVDDSAGFESVDIAELLDSATSEQTTVEPQTTDAQSAERSDDDSDAPIKDQNSFNIALSKRLERERKKYEASNEYQMGKALIEERMARDSVDADEAIKRIKADSIKAKAQNYSRNPEQFFADYLSKQQQTELQPQREVTPADRMAQELIAARDAGLIPQDFSPKTDITPEFVQNMQKYGTEAAIKMWELTRTAAQSAEVNKRKNSVQPMNVSGTSVSAPSVDFSSMSSKEFAAFDKKVKEATMRGKLVQF